MRVGIDLGTTFCVMAYIDDATGEPRIIKNRYGKATTPSILCFQPDGSILYGDDAKEEQLYGNPNAVSFFKRDMGNPNFMIRIYDKIYTATDLSTILLKKIIEDAELQLNQKIDSAVITVPAYFADKERKATMDAGTRAGIHVISIINEPTAAAFAYGLTNKSGSKTLLIYDLGGGTFDVTIAQITDDKITVLGSDGNHTLGGKNWDDSLVRYFCRKFKEETRIDLSDDLEMMNSLLVLAEKTKIQLSSLPAINVPINYKGYKVNLRITRELFEEISSILIESTKDLTDGLISSINITWDDIDGVILVGGSTRMKMVHDYVVSMSGKEPLSGVNVDEAVALGAAIRANIDNDGKFLSLPSPSSNKEKQIFSILGAKAISDVTSHSLGVILLNENGDRYINKIIIRKNSSIPANNTIHSKLRTHPGENELEIYVLQGEYERPLDNTILNKYIIQGVKHSSNNVAIIDITYGYTENGIVNVEATQHENGESLTIRIDEVPKDMSWTDEYPVTSKVNKKETMMPKISVMLCIDVSGSMSGEPIKEAKKAMHNFVSQLEEAGADIGIIAFADSAITLTDPISNFDDVNNYIDKLDVGCYGVGFGTSGEPFTKSGPILMGTKYNLKMETKDKSKSIFKIFDEDNDDKKNNCDKKERIMYIVILTDGVWGNQLQAVEKAHLCHANGIETMAIGFGSADYKFLKDISSTESFASFSNLSTLTESFSKIAQVISSGTKSLQI